MNSREIIKNRLDAAVHNEVRVVISAGKEHHYGVPIIIDGEIHVRPATGGKPVRVPEEQITHIG